MTVSSTIERRRNESKSIPPKVADRDDFLRRSVERKLQSSGYLPLRNIRCHVEDDVVMLFGTLPSYYMKQICQTVVMSLELVKRVENHCDVKYTTHSNI